MEWNNKPIKQLWKFSYEFRWFESYPLSYSVSDLRLFDFIAL